MLHRFNNWIPDQPDARDKLAHETFAMASVLPAKVDLTSYCSPVEDQGQLGSCTGNAIAGALEYLENKINTAFIDLSRLFVYYNERVLEHTVSQDAGAQIRDGIKSVKKWGVCSEHAWPYNVALFANKPVDGCYAEAALRKISVYARVTQDLQSLKAALATGFPVTFGFSVYASFESAAVAKSGKVAMPKKGEQQVGGHAVLMVGYDDKTKRFLVRNSWGAAWGLKGYFTIPYAYLTNAALASDFWIVDK